VGTDADETRARILDVAEEHFRRIGYHKTRVADIASELGMSPANVYRFFPSRDAINESICARVFNEVAGIALAIARRNAPAAEKLDQLLTAVHRQNKMKVLKERHMHDLIVVAMQGNWVIVKAYIERMVTIFEATIREGIQAGEFEVEDAAKAASSGQVRVHGVLPSDADRALRSTRRRYRSRPAQPDPLYFEGSRQV
jgi:AcrR family transcriptional regulator